ncbi:hypothetical protein STENM327S_01776 [Streptomyces tendae]
MAGRIPAERMSRPSRNVTATAVARAVRGPVRGPGAGLRGHREVAEVQQLPADH